jgi:hypothetical protein
MILLIAVPHQLKANLKRFDSKDNVITYANNHDDNKVYDNYEDAKEWITHDLHTAFWLESADDFESALNWEGHQASTVNYLVKQLIEKYNNDEIILADTFEKFENENKTIGNYVPIGI